MQPSRYECNFCARRDWANCLAHGARGTKSKGPGLEGKTCILGKSRSRNLRMISAIRLVKVSSQSAESVISRRYFCCKLIETRSVSGSNRSFRQIPVFSPGAIAIRADLSPRDFQQDLAPNPVVRFLAQNAVVGSWAGKLWLQDMGFPRLSTSGLTLKERYCP